MGLQYKGSWSKGRDGDCRVFFPDCRDATGLRVEGLRFRVLGYKVWDV